MLSRETARRWPALARETLAASLTDRVSLAASGRAFFAMLAIFPARSWLIGVYGLVFRTRAIEPRLPYLSELLRQETSQLIGRWMHSLVVRSNRRLGIGIGVRSIITIWSATVGTRALLVTLDDAYGTGQRSGFHLLNRIAPGLTITAIGVRILAAALPTLIPVALALLDIEPYRMRLTHVTGSLLLVLSTSGFIALLYRISSSGGMAPGRGIVPGAVLGTAAWLLALALLGRPRKLPRKSRFYLAFARSRRYAAAVKVNIQPTRLVPRLYNRDGVASSRRHGARPASGSAEPGHLAGGVPPVLHRPGDPLLNLTAPEPSPPPAPRSLPSGR